MVMKLVSRVAPVTKRSTLAADLDLNTFAVSSLFQKAEELSGLPANKLQLICGDVRLSDCQDTRNLTQAGVKRDITVHILKKQERFEAAPLQPQTLSEAEVKEVCQTPSVYEGRYQRVALHVRTFSFATSSSLASELQ